MFDENFYDKLSRYYDELQAEIDPVTWADFVHSIILKYCTAAGDGEGGKKILCDLGCGNGRVDGELLKHDYEIIGIDSSIEMLNKARENNPDILWLCQDITDYELFGTADVFVSLLDTINHILDEEDIINIFRSFKNYMSVGGIFVFDIGTYKHFAETLGDNVFFEDFDDFTLLWDNTFDEEEQINEASLTLFERGDDDLYERSDGVIEERYYDKGRLIEIASEAGLTFVGEDQMDDERVFLVFKRESL